jgi:type IV secretion system protein VirB6
MWLGGTLFLLATVGLLATTRIALAILLAIGPVFVVFALFPGTRGLFVGWLRGVVMLAIAPLFAVLGGSLMLELSVPVLAALVAVPGQIDAQAAMAFFMTAAVHAALMVLVLKVAGTMVAGWTVFGLARRDTPDRTSATRVPAAVSAAYAPSAAAVAVDQARGGTPPPSRQIRVPASAPPAANDGGAVGAPRGTRVVAAAATAVATGATHSPNSRAQGVGSRFRSPAARNTERLR